MTSKRESTNCRKKTKSVRNERANFFMYEVKWRSSRSLSDLFFRHQDLVNRDLFLLANLLLIIFLRFCHTSDLTNVLFLLKTCIFPKTSHQFLNIFWTKRSIEKIFWNFIHGTEKSAVRIQRVQKMKNFKQLRAVWKKESAK